LNASLVSRISWEQSYPKHSIFPALVRAEFGNSLKTSKLSGIT
jgi:hypothetical protein